jgi:hypothetical protein
VPACSKILLTKRALRELNRGKYCGQTGSAGFVDAREGVLSPVLEAIGIPANGSHKNVRFHCHAAADGQRLSRFGLP